MRRVGLSLLHSREASIAIAGIALVIYFQSTASAFLSGSNIANLAEYAATTAIIAAGEVMVLISGEVDLSVGQVYALCPFVMFYVHEAGLPFVPAIIAGLIPAAIIGLINGLVTVVLEIPSFITTLGTLFLINGLTLTISGGFPVAPKAGPLVTNTFGGNAISQILWAIGVTLIFQFTLVKTRWGMHTIATGGNLIGAAEVGVKTGLIKIGNFIICSVLGASRARWTVSASARSIHSPGAPRSCSWPSRRRSLAERSSPEAQAPFSARFSVRPCLAS